MGRAGDVRPEPLAHIGWSVGEGPAHGQRVRAHQPTPDSGSRCSSQYRSARGPKPVGPAVHSQASSIASPDGGEVEVRPGQAAGEVLQEQCSHDRLGGAGRVVGVGDLGAEALLVLLRERHPPERFAGGSAGGVEVREQRVVGGEDAADPLPERDLDRTGERGDVHQHVGLELGDRVGEAVADHEPALGVGVGDLGRATAVVGDHVARDASRCRRSRSPPAPRCRSRGPGSRRLPARRGRRARRRRRSCRASWRPSPRRS